MLENKTLDTIKDEILNNINLPLAKNEGSILSSIASGIAVACASIYVEIEDIYNDAFLFTLEGEKLDLRVKEFGVERKQGTVAGGYVQVEGADGVVFEDGMQLEANGLIYEYMQSGDTPISIVDGVAMLYIIATEQGSSYNLPPKTLFNTVDNIEGITSITNIEELNGGTDFESDKDLLERFFYIQSHKGTSGNVDDYVNWALEVNGVKSAKCIPLWNGNGTVKVIVMGDNNKNVSQDIITATKDYIEAKRPIGASVTVVTPTPTTINLTATVELKTGYTVDIIQDNLRVLIDSYCSSVTTEITYTKVGAILSSIEGVIDYSNLLINGANKNIKLTGDQVGSVGTITLTSGVID